MSESSDAIQLFRGEMASGFAATNQRIGTLENELHRHQDEDRSDMSAIRSDVRIITTAQATLAGRIEGTLGTLKWLIGIPAFIAAAGTVVGLIRHW